MYLSVGEGRSEGRDYTGEEYHIFDPIGIIGPANTEYIIEISEADVYWTEYAPVHGAQFSLLFDIKNEDGRRIGKGEMDKTCGKVFHLEREGRSLELTDTNYDISRNRLAGIIPMIILIIIMPVLTFIYYYFYKRKKREKDISNETILDMVFIAALGGVLSNIILHGSVLIVGLIFSLYRGYKLKWLIPGVLEIAFLLPMYGYVGDPYTPHITAFMGLTFSFLVLIWLTGYQRQKHESKLGNLVFQAV
ncbi:MAG: hypothetical protein ACOC35_08005 [Promethearchaeia archaeon]